MKLFTGQVFCRQSALQTCWTRRGKYDLSWVPATAVAQIPGAFFAFDSTSLGSGSGCSGSVTASIKYSTGIDCGRRRATTNPPPADRCSSTPVQTGSLPELVTKRVSVPVSKFLKKKSHYRFLVSKKSRSQKWDGDSHADLK